MGKNDAQIKISTLIGQNAVLLGDFTAEGSARIDGKITGDVVVTGDLIIGATGCVIGDVSAESAMIGGEIQGNVMAKEKTELMGTARVIGDISTKTIVIDENAVFQGKCDMNQEVPDKRSLRKQVKAVRATKKTAGVAIAQALREMQEAEQVEEEKGIVSEAEQTVV